MKDGYSGDRVRYTVLLLAAICLDGQIERKGCCLARFARLDDCRTYLRIYELVYVPG